MTTDSLTTKQRAKELAKRRRANPLLHIPVIGFGILMLYPVLWMFGSSFKPSAKVLSELSPFPDPITLENYSRGWLGSGIGFDVFFLNSAIVAGFSVLGNLLSCCLAAYAFARLNFWFRNVFFAIMMAMIMLPHHVLLIPQYMLFSSFGWVNSFLPLIAPKFLAVDSFFIFLMVQFIRSLPKELDEAARIDGAGPFQTFTRVVFPLIVPALATTAVFTFIWTWNDFLSALIYLSDPAKYTVPIGLNAFLDSQGEKAWGPMFAMAMLSLGPLFGFFLAGQKYLTQGIATTGLKG